MMQATGWQAHHRGLLGPGTCIVVDNFLLDILCRQSVRSPLRTAVRFRIPRQRIRGGERVYRVIRTGEGTKPQAA
jgi:hypothetical protein